MYCKTCKRKRIKSSIKKSRRTICIFKGSIYTSRANNRYKLTLGI